MSKQRTDLSKYRSPSTGDYCTSAQYIAEIICQRIADKEKIGTLAYKFWNQPKWKKTYIRQVSLANKLIKEYGDDFVRFIKSKSGSKIISLGTKDIKKKFEMFRSNLTTEKPIEVKEPQEKAVFKPRGSFGSKTMFSKIKEIDNGTN
jgi:hypothetical protein